MPRQVRTAWWVRTIVGVTLAAAAFGAYIRFADQNDVFCQSPDEMSEVMPGIRLHGLPVFNIGAPTRYNFIRSMFYSQHGLGDVSFYYLASAALSAIGWPVSERSLYFAGGLANVAFAFAGGAIGAYMLGNAATGSIFALLVLVSPFYVFVSKSGWARLTWTPLLLVLVFLCQWRAMRTRRVLWTVLFCSLAAFVALTDGFMMLPIVGVLGVVLTDGPGRFRRLIRDRVFLAGCAAIGLAAVVDLAVGFAALRRGTDLTMISYLVRRSGSGALVPSAHVLWAWTQSVDYYFPFRGAWVLVSAAFVLAAVDGIRGRTVGFVAAWWLLASIGVLRYAAAVERMNPASVPGVLNAYFVAPPSFLLWAWLMASVAEGRFLRTERVRPSLRAAMITGVVLITAAAMARHAYLVAFAAQSRPDLGFNRIVKYTDMPLSACRSVKAAAFYVRSHQDASRLPYVFHLSSDPYLGHIGEFYYGLSYTRSSQPEDPNHLLDFGWHQFSRRNPPEAFYRPYGVPRFDYYVAFTEERGNLEADRRFASQAGARLIAEGARIVCTIWDRGKPIARILSFRDEPATDLDYGMAATGWDRTFGRARTLMQEPLAGSSYHFGYNWRPPE